MKHKLFILPIFGSIIVFSECIMSCKRRETQPISAEPEVSVASPLIDSVVLTQSYPASISATQSADVVARVNGQLLNILFTAGDFVTTGQPLFSIESTTYRDQVNEAKAALETAMAEYDFAVRQNEAMQKALQVDAVSKMDVIQAESNLRQSEAAIKRAQAQLETAQTMLGYCTIRAPFSGLITKSAVSTGSYISGETSPVILATIYDDNYLHALFSVSTERYLQLRNSPESRLLDFDHVAVSFNDTLTKQYYGKLNYISPDVSKSTGTVTLRLVIDNHNGELRDGMYGIVKLPYATNPTAILVKDESIATDQLGKFVYTVNDSNNVVYTPIEVGDLFQDSLRIVTAGLKPNDRYVTTALMKVHDGMKVKPIR